MKWITATALAAAFAGCASSNAQEFLDELSKRLVRSTTDGQFRTRISGIGDLEYYSLPLPAPGLIFTDRRTLLNPRLSLYLDAQLGPHIYAFAQARVDRGFDPSDGDAQVRMDEYAIRYTPWEDGRFTVQVGKFSTVVGNWVQRHTSWDNPFVTAPVPYENVTAAWDLYAPASATEFLAWGHVLPKQFTNSREEYGDKTLRLPIVWGPSYTSGISISGRIGKFDYAAEFKNASLSSRPEAWDATQVTWSDPTVSARIGWRPTQNWNLGFSASSGAYMQADAAATLPLGRDIGDYRQMVLAQDISFSWHHLQIWAECYQCRFEVPYAGDADTLAYFIEAKYKLTPQLYAAARWNQQFFDTIRDDDGGQTKWGDDLWRMDLALGYRFSANSQLKLQYSLINPENAFGGNGHLFAGQFTVRF